MILMSTIRLYHVEKTLSNTSFSLMEIKKELNTETLRHGENIESMKDD
jgi:hypothetical protein